MAGLLCGEELARVYANMDAVVFPSKTNTFCNVVLEASASGVPALVTNEGGPQFIVKSGVTGYICRDNASFVDCIQKLKHSPDELQIMKQNARTQAESASWDSVFAAVYRAYQAAFAPSAPL